MSIYLDKSKVPETGLLKTQCLAPRSSAYLN